MAIPSEGSVVLSVRLRQDVKVEAREGGGVTLQRSGVRPLAVPEVGALFIEGLAGSWMTEAKMDELADSSADPRAVYVLGARLFSLGLLEARCTLDGEALFSLVPAPDWSEWRKPMPAPDQSLSPHAWLRRDGERFVLGTLLSRRKCLIHHEKCLGWLMGMAVKEGAAHLDDKAYGLFRKALSLTGVLEEDEPASLTWEFHDLLFHHYSSIGFHDDPMGATRRLEGVATPPPLLKECTGVSVSLPEPDAGLMERLRAPFAEVLGLRRSSRIAGDKPLTMEELGALLHASARIQLVRDDPAYPSLVSFRPSPSGGGLHSLEIYPLVYRCDGHPWGAWRYDPGSHRLESVEADESRLKAYMEENPHALIEDSGLPHIRLVITSRFLRNAWKYEKIAYRLVLQDLGCLYQTLSLAASALGLASCILGAVDARRLGEILRLDPLAEPVIGEMTLSAGKGPRTGDEHGNNPL